MFFSKRAFNALSSSSRCSGDSFFLLLLMLLILLYYLCRIGVLSVAANQIRGPPISNTETEHYRNLSQRRKSPLGRSLPFVIPNRQLSRQTIDATFERGQTLNDLVPFGISTEDHHLHFFAQASH